MRVVPLLALAAVLTGCAATPDDPAATAPPGTVSRKESFSATTPPGVAVATRENAAVVAAALPEDTDLPGYARQANPPRNAVVRLCPTVVESVSDEEAVHAWGVWTKADASLSVVAVLDPAKAPADRLLAALVPQECPERDESGTTFVHDRQPYERDGWEGWLNTSLGTAVSGARYYVSSYLLSRGDALVNVVAEGAVAPATTFDPTVDEAATHYVQLVLDRFAA